MSVIATTGEQRLLLHEVPWQTYLALANTPDRAGKRITYDRGEMEITSPSRSHETDKSILRRMVEAFAIARNIDISSAASTTFTRLDLERGFEPDESYYIQNESIVRGRQELDLLVDPPPDLVIEIEHTRSAINKLSLFAEFGIPEVWRYNGCSLWIGRLASGDYESMLQSEVLEGFPVSLAVEILKSIGTHSETKLLRMFSDSL